MEAAGFTVYGLSASGEDVSFIEAHSVRHIAVPLTRRMTPVADLRSVLQMVRVMRREKFTIVHTHTPKPGLLGQLAARLAGVPIVINTLHGFYFHDHMSPTSRKFYILLEKLAATCSDVILSQNQEDIKTAVAEDICAPDKIKWLGNGIDLQRFDPSSIHQADKQRLREELGIPATAPIVGFVGRLVQEKGVLELMQAARLVLQEAPETYFLLVGLVDYEKADAITPDVAQEFGLADRCIFTGLRQDVPQLYNLMDIFVLPSHREGFPRAPMEAAAMGLPCVVTDVRGCRETVQDGQNGFLVPLQDSQALTQAIQRLLANPQQRREFGETGRKMAQEKFDERLVFARVKDEYVRLLRQKELALPREYLLL